MLELKNLGVHFGDRSLFEQVNLLLYSGHRYGLVGANGSGKSTLLKILSGEQSHYSGSIHWPSHCKMGVLEQDHFQYEQQNLIETVVQGRQELWRNLQIQHELSQKAEFSEADTLKFSHAQTIIEKENGYAAESEAARLLVGLGIAQDKHDQPLKNLSGGFKLRALMARLLFSQPEMLLLDEPTNHLDLYAIKWLGEYLKKFPGLLLVVSHDRDFLNEVCSDTIDIDYGTARLYSGNYDAFVEAKAMERELKEKNLVRQDKLRDTTQQFIDRFRSKATKASAVQSRVKMLDKLESIELRPTSRRYPHFKFEPGERSGAVPLEVKEVSKSYGQQQVLNQVSFEVQRGDHIALIGPNGIGKSTLLKIMMKDLEADQGKVKWKHGADVGYFPQDYHDLLSPDLDVYSWLSADAEGQAEARLRSLLGSMLFVGDSVKHKISTLSGGEATRLVFTRLILKGGNLLVLDEPTNHLDMEAIETLAQALHDYPGSVICVSHNRYFVKQIANRILELTPEGLNDFRGSYDEYLEQQGTDHLERSLTAARSLEDKPAKQEGMLAYEEQKQAQRKLRNLERKLPELEKSCQILENRLVETEQELAESYLSGTEAQQQNLLRLQIEVQAAIEQAYSDWEQAEAEMEVLTQSFTELP